MTSSWHEPPSAEPLGDEHQATDRCEVAYQRHDVRKVWLVHPTLFSVEVFTLQNGMHIDEA